MRPVRADGTTVDATFQIYTISVFDVVYHHKAGGRGTAASVNADYHEGLELLLTRLAQLSATILGIAVDSSVARKLAPEDRQLGIPFPIQLTPATPCDELRLRITRAERSVARRENSQPGGGNDQRRIRVTVTVAGRDVSAQELAAGLERGFGGTPPAGGSSTEAEATAGNGR